MTLDSEHQRKILLELITAATFPGAAIEVAYEIKKAVVEAKIEADDA